MMKFYFSSMLLLAWISTFAQTTIREIPALIPKEINGKFGYVNQSGKVLIKPDYKLAMFFTEDCNLLNSPNKLVRKFGSKNYATVERNGIVFRINKLGKRVYMLKDKDLGKCNNTFIKQPYWAYRYKGKFGLVDKVEINGDNKDDFIIPAQYQLLHIMEGNDNYNPMVIAVKGNKFGVIDKENKVIIPFVYDDIKRNFSWKLAHLFEVTKDGKNYFFIDENNKAY